MLTGQQLEHYEAMARAIDCYETDTLEALLAVMDPNLTDEHHRPLLEEAAEYPDLVRMLLRAKIPARPTKRSFMAMLDEACESCELVMQYGYVPDADDVRRVIEGDAHSLLAHMLDQGAPLPPDAASLAPSFITGRILAGCRRDLMAPGKTCACLACTPPAPPMTFICTQCNTQRECIGRVPWAGLCAGCRMVPTRRTCDSCACWRDTTLTEAGMALCTECDEPRPKPTHGIMTRAPRPTTDAECLDGPAPPLTDDQCCAHYAHLRAVGLVDASSDRATQIAAVRRLMHQIGKPVGK